MQRGRRRSCWAHSSGRLRAAEGSRVALWGLGVSAERTPHAVRVITRLNVGGPARQEISLTRGLRDRGWRAELVTGVEGPAEGRIEPTGLSVTLVPTLQREPNIRRDRAAARALRHLIQERSPDVVHTNLAKAGALGRWAAHRAGVPVIVHTFHGHVLDGYFSRGRRRAYLEVERRLAGWSDALLAVSAATRDELLGLGIGRPDQWHVMPLGIELESLEREPPSAAEARASLRLPPSGPVVGIVGRLVPIKDHETFLLAAREIVRSRPETTFAIAGDGEMRPALERRARELGLGESVRFLGWVQDLPMLYAATNLVVLTSRNEGTPVSLIEASTAGKPVVATRVGGVPEVVQDGRTGFLVQAREPAAVARQVLRILETPELGASFGRVGRASTPERFSAARLAERTDELYRELVERHRR